MNEDVRRTVELAYERWNSGDVELFLESVHPDVIWEPSGAFPGIAIRYDGHPGVRRFWDDFMTPWDEMTLELTELVVLETDTALARVRFRACGREGIEVEHTFGQHYEIRDGLLHRMRSYASWDDAVLATRPSDRVSQPGE